MLRLLTAFLGVVLIARLLVGFIAYYVVANIAYYVDVNGVSFGDSQHDRAAEANWRLDLR